MGVKGFIGGEAREGIEIAKRFKRRDFSGNSGKVMKNSFWQIATTLTAKIGSLLFTIILARLMLPEVYGLYGLALTTILFFGIFSDLGIGEGIGVFIAKLIDKSPGKAKGYFYYFMKYKVWLLFLSSLLIILLAKFLANDYYNKPIFYAILAGAIYLPIQVLTGFIGPLFNLRNDFKPQFIKEIIVQVSRLVILPLAIIYFLREMPIENYLFWVFLILSFCYFLSFLYIWILAKLKHPFGKAKQIALKSGERVDAWKFILPLSVTALSGVFFGLIDQIMLGHYVSGAFLGFYQSSFNLISSAALLIGFGSAAVFPVLARLKGKKLERGFRKVRNLTLLISLASFIFTVLVAKYLILLIYGGAYLTAYYYMIPLSLLLISFPMIAIYQTYYMSQKRSKLISILLIGSTVLNIFFNFVFINLGLIFGAELSVLVGFGLMSDPGMFWGVMGACVATILSRYLFLGGLILGRRKRGFLK
jgi:O-antigen/teichoic acid export membrane protein